MAKNNRNEFILFLCCLAFWFSMPCALAATSNLGESSEVMFCNGIQAPYAGCAASDLRARADALNSPVTIYEYLLNNYDYALYHGARSGSVNAFLGGRGNDVDLAATLIAMLRSQGIPAQYVVGTVRAPSAQVENWLGVEDPTLAASLLTDQGIQGVVLATDKSTIDFEHVWVEALIPYSEYRGAGNSGINCSAAPASCSWVPLDPSFKQHVSRNSGLDPYSSLTFDYTAYYKAIANQDSARMGKNPLEIYQGQVLNWLQTAAPGKNLTDIPDFTGISAQWNGLLPASLPYQVVSAVRRYNTAADHDAAVPAIEPKKWGKSLSMTLNLTATTTGGGTVTFNVGMGPVLLTDLATQRLTLTTQIVGGIPNMILRLGGAVIATPISGGGTISGYTPKIGDPFILTVSMDGAPATVAGQQDNVISATYNAAIGGYYLIASGGETSNWSQVHRAAQQLLSANQQYRIVFNPAEAGCVFATGLNCTPYVDAAGTGVWASTDPALSNSPAALDALTGGLLYVAGMQYYAKYRDDIAMADGLNKTKTPISGFLGVVSSTFGAEYIDGTAFSILPSGLLIDMKGITINGPWRINQPSGFSNNQFEFIGHVGSSLEHETWQELTGYDAISTVRGIQIALAGGSTLVNPLKNQTVDTMAAAYTTFGFGSGVAPAGYTYVPFTVFGNRPATWTNTASPSSFDLMLSQVSTATPALQQSRATYAYWTNTGLYGWTNCVAGQIAAVQSYPSTVLLSGKTCDGTPFSGTPSQVLSTISSDWTNTIIPLYIGQAYFNYFDLAQGFVPANYVYRADPIAPNAQFSSFVNTIRNNLYLRDLTKSWVEYLVPSQQSVGPNFKFAVDIRKEHDTATGNLLSESFEILNNTGIAAGGGYVGLPLSTKK